MKIIPVNASRSYCVHIGEGLLSTLGKEVAALMKPGKAAIISDSNVWPLYGKEVTKSLEKVGFETVNFVFPAGEASKTSAVYLEVLNFLAENHITRSDCVIALGGGVVGDLTGFAAATFLRGIAYIQVPKAQASSGISLRAFILVACVLLAILLLSGSLSYFIPPGEFFRDEGSSP